MATTVADLKVKFSADGADKTKRDINDVSGAVDGANGRMGGFRSTLVGTFGGLLSYNMFSGMIGGLKDVGMGFINSNSQIEDFRQMLVVATGDMEKADAVLANMRDIAATSPFEFPELADAARVLESFGVSSEKWIPTIGNTAAATGKSIDQVTQALLDAQTGEFERLKELGIRTEVEGDKVRFSFMKNGKMMTVEAENTQEGIENALMGIWDDKYDGAMDQMSDTWTGRMANLKDNIGMMMQDAGKPIFELAKAGVGLANEWFDAFNEFRTKGMSPLNAGIAALGSVITAHLGAKAGAAFQKFATGALNAFDRVVDVVSDLAETIGDVLGDAFEFLVDHGDMVVGALKGIGVAFAGLATAAVVFGVIGGAIALVTSPLFILMAAAAALGVAWQTNFLGIRDITATVVDFLVDAFNTVKDAIQFIMDGFDTGGWSEAWERVKQIASDAWDAIKNLVTDAFDSIRDTISNVDWGAVWDTLVSGAQAAIGWVIDAISNVDWGSFLSGAWQAIKMGLEFAWQQLSQIDWSQVIGAAVEVGAKILAWAKEQLGSIKWSSIVGIITSVGAGVLNWAKGLLGSIDWGKVVGKVKDVGAGVLSYAKDTLGSIKWSSIVGSITSVGAGILNWAKGLLGSISWSDLFGAALDLGQSILTWITDQITVPTLSFPSASEIANAIGKWVADQVGIDGGNNYDFEDTPTDVEAPPENVAGRPGAAQLGMKWDQPLDPSGLMGGANTGMFDAIVEAAQAAQAAIVSFVSTTIGVMGGWTTGIQTIVNSAADTLKSRASGATAGAAASFIAFVSQTIGVMGGWTTGIQTMVNTTMDALKSRASGGTAAALASFVAFVSQTIGVMGGWATGIQTMVNTTLDVLKERSSGGTSAAKASFTAFTSDTSASIRSWGSTVASTARSAMSDLASAVRSGMSSATASIRSESGAWSGIINAAAGALGAAGYNAGAAAGYGVANGLRAAQGSVAAAAADIIATVDAAMRKAGEIRSPSRRTGRVGKELTRGVASYMTSLDVMRDLQRAAGDVVGAVDGTLSTGMAGLSYGAPGLYSMPGGRAYAYAATAPVASGRSLSIGTINITQREGEDGEAFLDRVFERLASDFDDVGGLKGA